MAVIRCLEEETVMYVCADVSMRSCVGMRVRVWSYTCGIQMGHLSLSGGHDQ